MPPMSRHGDDWHDDALTVTAVLVEHAQALVRAVALLVEHESHAAAALSSVLPAGQDSS
ncbi:hypothetical protein BH09ACT7_BH09ACT7_44070 [soil metagenome]